MHFTQGCLRAGESSGEGPVSPQLGFFGLPAWPVLLRTLPLEAAPTTVRRGGRGAGRRVPGLRGSPGGRGGPGVGGVRTCCLRSSLGWGFPALRGGVTGRGGVVGWWGRTRRGTRGGRS